MTEVGGICTRTIEAGDRGCYEEFFWNLVLDSGARGPGGGARGAIAPQLFVSMGWICLCPPP